MKKLILISASIVIISTLGTVCMAAYGQMLCNSDFSGGMPDGRVYSADEPPYPYLPTQNPKEPPVTPTPPIEPPD